MSNTSKETNDLTVIMLTANEHPEYWTAFHKETLLKAIGNYPLIVSSRLPVDYGINIIQTEPISHRSMYRQLLNAAKLATTPFVAVAESDVLYTREHFEFYRPPMDAVAYDMSRWILFTWNPSVFSHRRRITNATLIAPREYLIDALEERYGDNSTCPDDRIGEVGRHIHEKALSITLHNAIEVWCNAPSVQIYHENTIFFQQAHHPTRKRMGEIKAYDIPNWGKSVDLIKHYR